MSYSGLFESSVFVLTTRDGESLVNSSLSEHRILREQSILGEYDLMGKISNWTPADQRPFYFSALSV